MNKRWRWLLVALTFARDPSSAEPAPHSVPDVACTSPNALPAVTGNPLRAHELKIVAGFDPVDGHGELAAYSLDAASGLYKESATWKAHEQMGGDAARRAVITNNGPVGARFRWETLNAAKRQALMSGAPEAAKGEAQGRALLQWLRGEGDDASPFRIRARHAALGAVVNSSPAVQTSPRAGYFGPAFAGYGEFAGTWARRRPIVWVGAADGMLHGFDASAGAEGGKPLLSYVPEALFARLPEVAAPGKPRLQPMVDGSASIADVRIGAAWATFLFSPLGRGAKAIVALDVTDPEALIDESKADKMFRWQFSSADDEADLGYVVNEPTSSPFSRQAGQVAPMNNGKFALLSGNGVQSASGKAVLYILFADGPSERGDWTGRFVKLVADAGPDNGLSQPVWVDEDNDGVADSIYAADLKSRLWKFDVRGSDPASWKLAYGGRPLFAAKDAAGRPLPLVSAPEFRFHPQGGVILLTATGLASGQHEPTGMAAGHALFGIWDKPDLSRLSAADLDAALPRGAWAQLEERSLHGGPDGTVRVAIGEPIDWQRKHGWVLPFGAAQELAVGNLLAADGQVLLTTLSPGTKSPSERSACGARPVARLIAVNPFTGLPADGLLGWAPGKTRAAVPQSIASVQVDGARVRIVRDVIGRTAQASRKCKDGRYVCSRVVGKEVDKQLAVPNNKARLFWSEVPGQNVRP